MRKIASLFLGILLTACTVPAEPQEKESGPVIHIEAKKAAELLAAKDAAKRPLIVDIRTKAEFDGGHLKDAKNIDFFADDFEAQLAKLDKNKPYILHCQSGGRSKRSLDQWKKLGFKKVYHLDGGFLGWKRAKLPVVK